KVAQQYKSLFVPGAKVADDINASFFDGETQTPFRIQQRTVDEYIQRVKKFFPKGIRTDQLNHALDLSQVAQWRSRIYIHRIVTGNSASGYLVRNQDTLLLSI